MISQPSPAFARLLELVAEFTTASSLGSQLQSKHEEDYTELVDQISRAWTSALAKKEDAEAAIVALVKRNPDWFKGKKSIITPHGTITKRESTKLEVANPDVTTRLIIGEHGAPEIRNRSLASLMGRAAELLHIEITPNLEALEKLSDGELAMLGIKRTVTETYTVKPATPDLGKAVETRARAKAKLAQPAAA